MENIQTITAIASGNINQAISIIRISGNESLNIAQKIFKGKIEKNYMSFGQIHDKGELIDETMLVFYKKPNSFTGEDLIEIFPHGGIVNTQRILQLIISHGAIMANRGEFSLRAFLNSKMNLVKAQNINNLINAKNLIQAKIATNLAFSNETNVLINNLKKEVLNLIAVCEINIDYPEYDDVEQLTTNTLLPRIEHLIKKTRTIIENSENASLVFNGIKIAIIGEPNVGKSSLLNLLLKKDKSIVTNIPGTTRDVVEGEVIMENNVFRLFDTAGIRESKNMIENMGIKKTIEAIEDSNIVIHLKDASKNTSRDENNKKIFEKYLKNKNVIVIYNKGDLIANKNNFSINKNELISVKEKEINNLRSALDKLVPKIKISDDKLLLNSREIGLLKKAHLAFLEVKNGLSQGYEPDTVIIDLQDAWNQLENILGNATHTKLLDEIFSNFCLGK